MNINYLKILNLREDSNISDEIVKRNYDSIKRQIQMMIKQNPNNSQLLKYEENLDEAYKNLNTKEKRKEYLELLVEYKKNQEEEKNKNRIENKQNSNNNVNKSNEKFKEELRKFKKQNAIDPLIMYKGELGKSAPNRTREDDEEER